MAVLCASVSPSSTLNLVNISDPGPLMAPVRMLREFTMLGCASTNLLGYRLWHFIRPVHCRSWSYAYLSWRRIVRTYYIVTPTLPLGAPSTHPRIMNHSCMSMKTLDYWKPHKLEKHGIQQVSEARDLLETYGANLSPSNRVVAENLLAQCVDPFPYWDFSLICCYTAWRIWDYSCNESAYWGDSNWRDNMAGRPGNCWTQSR
jgi:hypothetical protein